MSSSDFSQQDRDLLHPNLSKPVPLPHDFHLKLIDTPNPATASVDTLFPIRENNEKKYAITDLILQQNEQAIQQSARQAAITNATSQLNRSGAVFHDLVPLSFDEEEFIRKEEAEREKRRQNLARRKS